MAEKKQLVVVVESTSALAPYWSVIFNDYLRKIIRSFCADGNQELALVNYNFREAYSPRLVETSSWTDDMDAFMERLYSLDLSGDTPIEEALAEALKLFPAVNIGIQNPQRHCILIAATNPTPIPENHLPDAETVAKSFPECMISLSVISPNELLKLRAIYAAAKRTPLETGFTIDMARNEDYLVLISESLTEVWAAFSQSEIKHLTISQIPIQLYAPILPESPTLSPESVQEVCDFLNEDEDSSRPTSVGNYIPPPTSDPSTVYSSMISGETSMSSLKEMASSSLMNENVQNSEPVVPNILNSLAAHSRDLVGSLNVSNIIAGGGMTSTPTEQPAESATLPGTSGTNDELVNIWD